MFESQRRVFLYTLLPLMVGIVFSSEVPDIDLRLSFLSHRSMITHSGLFTLICVVIWWWRDCDLYRYVAMGASMGAGVHLAFDLFPRAWQGFALIAMPAYGRLSPVLSVVWLGVNFVFCLYVGFRLVYKRRDVGWWLGGLLLIFWIEGQGEYRFWWPLLVMMVGVGGVVWFTTYKTDFLRASNLGERTL